MINLGSDWRKIVVHSRKHGEEEHPDCDFAVHTSSWEWGDLDVNNNSTLLMQLANNIENRCLGIGGCRLKSVFADASHLQIQVMVIFGTRDEAEKVVDAIRGQIPQKAHVSVKRFVLPGYERVSANLAFSSLRST